MINNIEFWIVFGIFVFIFIFFITIHVVLHKNYKILIILSISLLIVSIGAITTITMNKKESIDYNRITLNINSNSNLSINNYELYDNDKVVTTNNDYINNNYSVVDLKEFDDYIILVYSKEKKQNKYYLHENYNKLNIMYLIDKSNGNAKELETVSNGQAYRIEFDSIKFINENVFIYNLLDIVNDYYIGVTSHYIFYYKEMLNIAFEFLLSYIPEPIHYTVENYDIVISNDTFICRSKESNETEYHVETFSFVPSFRLVEIPEKNSFSYSFSLNQKTSKESYMNSQKYVKQGYYKLINNTIYFLDNDLNIKNLSTLEVVKKINDVSEWNNFIL